MSETKNDESEASGALEWTGISWRSTDASHKRRALTYGWHIAADFVLLDHARTVGHAYSEAEAQRWVAEGVLP
jgi:hypothetical protein